ncbi:grasp-with-spasm system SPASM domain peptide maturase [Chryseobacterium sp. NFX27]|uniref:grasp-with-spasm system SPASM domain peptide maturase n=1 Tax=Chryseobacterium sp. NFX27 TaxID=2819618 RepID=UPI003CE7C52D
MVHKENFLLIYTNVFFVKGHTRTMILDLLKNDWIFFDNEYADLIDLFANNSVATIAKSIDPESQEDFYNFIQFLLNNDYACYVDDISLFPKIEEVWHTPYKITNCIIDFSDKIHEMEKISNNLFLLGCQYIELRFYSDIQIVELQNILKYLKNKDFRNIHIILKYNSGISNDSLFNICKDYLNLSFTLYNAPINEYFKNELENVLPSVGYIHYIKQNIIDCTSCGIINSTTFLNPKNIGVFMSNKLYNSCLNRKISIDIDGNIKNCPSMKESYGNINEISLLDAYKNESFRNVWSLNKDMISTCKDCEFRYVCSDCRAYTEVPDDHNSKPLKCGYDPYTGEWEDWSKNPFKQKSINYYKIQTL